MAAILGAVLDVGRSGGFVCVFCHESEDSLATGNHLEIHKHSACDGKHGHQ